MSQMRTVKTQFQIFTLILALSSQASAGAWQYQVPFRPLDNKTNSTSTPGSSENGLFGRVTIAPVPYVYTPAYPPKSSTNWLPFAMIGAAMLPMVFSDAAAERSTQPQAARTKYQLAKDAPAETALRQRKNNRRSPASFGRSIWPSNAAPSQNQYRSDTAEDTAR